MIDSMLIIGANMLFWLGVYINIDREIQKERNRKYFNKLFGGSLMYDKKLMKLIKLDQVGKYLSEGTDVYMVMGDGQLVLMNLNTDWSLLFSHQLMGGRYAVYRQKKSIGNFTRAIHIGGWSFSVSHTEKGDDEPCA